MVWYVPPLSPIMNYFEGKDSLKNPDMIFPAIEEMRTPIQYLANMLTAGDTQTVKEALQRMAMMRSYMRAKSSGQEFERSRLERIGMTAQQTEEMYRLLAIAKYEDRFVIPTSHKEQHMNPYRAQGSAGYGNAMGDMGSGSGCDGCGPASSIGDTMKTGKEMYEENFYGGIWRD